MTQVRGWFGRRFDFEIPSEMLPNVEARLRGTPARLEDLLRDCPQSTLVRKPSGKWSAQEHAGHLYELEGVWLSRVNDYLAGHERLTPADLTNRGTDEANYNGRLLGDIFRDFRYARQALLRRLHQADGSAFSGAIPHPRLGTPMRLIDHLHFVAEHDDHHLAHMWELITDSSR
ncbi:MAG TPA: DinB family protein [Bryobacteraceae bacterium]|nr:DinB family protein [Bryobacteraceae bacterium]